VTFRILIDEVEALPFVSSLPEKSRRIVLEKLFSLEDDPFPGKGGDKELIKAPKGRSDEKVYRLHIGHSYTAFYRVDVPDKAVYITEVMTIEQAHKKYDRL
jgi:mRNA-degrading endonuclease RelE of RelBE toxin-antitoxin system